MMPAGFELDHISLTFNDAVTYKAVLKTRNAELLRKSLTPKLLIHKRYGLRARNLLSNHLTGDETCFLKCI